jgi:hypothetical protein
MKLVGMATDDDGKPKPVVEVLTGGATRASVPHGYRVPDNLYSPAERQARAKYREQVERQRNPHRLPLLPTGDDGKVKKK